MTTTKATQPRYPFTRWIDAPLAAVRYLNAELTGTGEAIARSNRGPQSCAQADWAVAKREAWA